MTTAMTLGKALTLALEIDTRTEKGLSLILPPAGGISIFSPSDTLGTVDPIG